MGNHRLATAAALLQSQDIGDNYNAKSFINATWVFLEALKEAANGKALLDEWGKFVSASTLSDEYGRAWRTGVDRCNAITPHEPQVAHVHNITTNKPETHHVHDWLLDLRDQSQSLRWDHELETLGERLELLLDRQLDDESRADISQWWRSVRAIRSRAALICADGCAILKSLSDRGIESWHVSFLNDPTIGRGFAADVKGAVAAIVQELQVRKEGDHPKSANKAKLFPKGVPSNADVVDLVVRLDAERDSGKSYNEIAREFTNGNHSKARSLLATIRRMKREGRLTL